MEELSTVEVAPGRSLAYARYGSPNGVPVVAFHGVPGSRVLWSLFDDAAAARDITLYGVERPGFGRSGYQPGRELLDWPADVRALGETLALDRFGLLGFSAGGPHALACAHAIPDRLRGVAISSGVTPPWTRSRASPFHRAFLDALRFVPGCSLAAFGVAAWYAHYASPAFRAGLRGMVGPTDRPLFDGATGDVLVADACEAFHGGARGPAHDLQLVGNDWGFDAAAVDVPLALFHGRTDDIVGIDLARTFADELSDVDLHVTDGGHYSTLLRSARDILTAARDSGS